MTDTLPRKQPIVNKSKFNFGYLWLLSIIILLALGWFGFMKVIDFNTKYEIKKQRVLSMVWHWPLKVEERQPQEIKVTLPEYKGDITNDPIKIYVCTKFGIENCRVALGIMQAESGFRPDAYHINVNKDGSTSLDSGIWEINSSHFNQPGCDLKSTLDPIRATDCAFSLYKAAGDSWHDWVTFNNGAYLSSL